MYEALKRIMPYRLKKVIKLCFYPRYYLNITLHDLLSKFGKYDYPNRVIFIAGLPKSGTTWIENFLYCIPGYCPRNLYGPPEILKIQDIPKNAFKYFPKKGYSSVKTHMNPKESNFEVLKKNGINKIVVMWRDPRDIVISRYYHLLKNPKKPGELHYIDYNKMTKKDALYHSMKVVLLDYIPWIKDWQKKINSDPNNYLLITYEMLLENSFQCFTALLDFYSIDLKVSIIKKIQNKTENIKKGETSIFKEAGLKSTYRKGIRGDWKNNFTDELKELFKQNAGEFLIELKYERNLNW